MVRLATEPEPLRSRTDEDRPSYHLTALTLALPESSVDEVERASTVCSGEFLQRQFDRSFETKEVACVRTCRRVELLLWMSEARALDFWESRLPVPSDRWRHRSDGAAVRHLFRVAAGLESVAVGEREVRAQVRRATRTILTRHPRSALKGILVAASTTADELAGRVPASRSVAAIAAARALAETGPPFPRVLIVGSGTVGRQVAHHLATAARLSMLYHVHPPPNDFLRATGVRAAPIAALPQELALADVVITAAKSRGRLIDVGTIPSGGRPLVILDLGLPRNVDPAVGRLPGMTLIDTGGLARCGEDDPAVPVVARHVDERADEIAQSLRALALESAIDEYRRDVEAVRRRLLATTVEGDLAYSAEQRRAVDRLSRQLIAALVDPPTRRLRELPPFGEGLERRARLLAALHPASRGP
jgi:glutamyl-tRNA reductase